MRNKKLLRIAGLLTVTIVALGLMVLISAGSLGGSSARQTEVHRQDQPAAATAAVALLEVEREEIEILDTYSGMIRPWERYTLAFEVAGRVKSLGRNQLGAPCDDGDRVTQGQVLAQLDERVFRARENETSARLEQAQSDWQRAREVQEQDIGAISDADVQQRLTELAVAKAAHEMAVKNLDDSVLVAPVDSTISRRLINVGESVAPYTPAFELIEVNRVLLVLGVPESNIPELQARMREVERNGTLDKQSRANPEDQQFKAYVRLIDRNRYGRPREPLVGTVYRISETADDRTGLFEVEVELPNEGGALRPGMIARAELVTRHVVGYRVPSSSVVFRSTKQRSDSASSVNAYVFGFEPVPSDVQATGFVPGAAVLGHVRRVDLVEWVEQRDEVIVIEASQPLEKLVWRGQHRLANGQRVRWVPFDKTRPNPTLPDPTLQPHTVQAGEVEDRPASSL